MKEKIFNSDYWGTYNGYKVYRYFGPKDQVPAHSQVYKDFVFAIDGELWYRSVKIGKVNNGGVVTDWDPKRAERNSPPPKKMENFKVEKVKDFKIEKMKDFKLDIDKVISNAMKRSVEDMVGEKLGEYKKNG